MTTYPKLGTDVPANPRFPEIEDRVRAYWDADGTFRASIDARPADSADGTPGGNELDRKSVV